MSGEASGFRAAEPRGKTAAFVAAVRDKQGPGFIASWLSPLSCAFTDTTILTTGFGADRLNVACAAEIERCGIVVRACPEVTRAFYDSMDGAV